MVRRSRLADSLRIFAVRGLAVLREKSPILMRRWVFEMVEGGEVPQEEAVGVGALDEFQVAGLAGFDDAGGG